MKHTKKSEDSNFFMAAFSFTWMYTMSTPSRCQDNLFKAYTQWLYAQ